ncbi:hypothetical protein HUU62_15765 [Rhodoferax sp. 4810]|uniref:Uncharacterized protein n=1 Tax=Thiospirillum jenense TaxID=1653858 RepID=A0A839HFH5_9GAMM|nr:hypothetical protein [Rhodoferax jenense]MBB1126116.1 hypothetical protein [Thiospirillum jenense]
MPTHRILAALLWLTTANAFAADAKHGAATVTLGYDSNPAQTADATARAFVHTAVSAATHPTAAVTVGLDGWWRHYDSADTTARVEFHADWSAETAHGLGVVTATLAAAAFRDTLVPADERNEIAFLLRYDHVLTARDMLGISGELRQLNYLHRVLPWAGRPGAAPPQPAPRQADWSSAPSPPHLPPPPAASVEALKRTDLLTQLGFDATHHWSATVASVLTLTLGHCASSLSPETYTQHGVGGVLRLEPARRWQLELGLDWKHLRYDQAPQQRQRRDAQRAASIALRRDFAHSSGTCRLDWLDSDSNYTERTFQQQVFSCGLDWEF